MDTAAKNKTLLWVGAGAGVVALLSCCCLGGVGGWFFFRSTPPEKTPPEKTLLGKWGIDIEAMKKNSKWFDKDFEETASRSTLEYKADNTFALTFGPGSPLNVHGRYKVLKTSGNKVTIE